MQGDLTPPEGKKCFSGIPEAHFIDDVDSHMKGEESAEAKIKELDEVHQKYKFMENSLSSRRRKKSIKQTRKQICYKMAKKNSHFAFLGLTFHTHCTKNITIMPF